MSGEYYLLIRSAAGVKLAQVDNYDWLKYTKVVNAPGLLSFQLDGDHSDLAHLTDKALVEVWRRDKTAGVGWYIDFYGMYRGMVASYKDRETVVALCPGQLHQMAWRTVAYHSGQNQKSSFSGEAAGDVIDYLIYFNATTAAISGNGRLRSGVFSDRTFYTDGWNNYGNPINLGCTGENLLDVMQRVARMGGIDFDLQYEGGSSWRIAYFPDQLGQDRSASVIFALNRGNMANPALRVDHIEEKTVAIVGGQGEGTARTFRVILGDDYASTNNIEVFRPYTNSFDPDVLDDFGAEQLALRKVTSELRFEILQSGPHRYGRDYFLGDLVTASYRDVNRVFKLNKVTCSTVKTGAERVDIEVL